MRDLRKRTISHILHVAALRNVAGGGLPASWLALRSSLPASVRMSVLLPRESAGFAWVKDLRALGVATYFAASALQIVRTVARLRPDIMHVHFVKWQVVATVGALICGARVIWHLHSGVAEALPRQCLKRVFVRAKYFLARMGVETFVCVSEDIKEYLRQNGVPAAKITEIPNGVELDFFHFPLNEERQQAHLDLKVSKDYRVIVFFGRDAYIKGADRLAEALEHIKTTTGQMYDVLCVASSPESISLLSPVARVHDLGVVSDIRNVLWVADALALPSRVEALPFTVLEARATGLPVIANDLPGMRHLINDPGTTLVQYSAPEFASALERALQQRIPLPKQMADALSIDAWTDCISALYGLRSNDI